MSSEPSCDPQPEPNQAKKETNLWRRYFGWICFATVEPVMWLYYMAYKLTSVVEQAFFLDKACRVDHGFPDEICDNLTANATLNAQVQVTVSTFIQWDSIAGYAFPIIISVFFGGWSDRRGRKVPLMIALTGKAIESGMLVVNSLMDTWNLNTILYSATLPMAMMGSDVVIYACCFSYVADVSSNEQRTLRVTILNVVYLSCSPIGTSLGSYLYYNVVNMSYTAMFAIQGVFYVLAILFSAFRLETRTTPKQMPMERGTNIFQDFFDKQHVVDMAETLTKRRRGHRRLYLWILLLSVALYAVQKSEHAMSYLYTQIKFAWNVADFSNLRTFQTTIQILVMLFGVSIMKNLLGMRDTVMVFISASSWGLGKLTIALAETPVMFYVGAAVSAFGPIVGPVLRSMSTKVAPATERGKVLALVCVCDKAMPLLAAPTYSQIYNATLTTIPSAIYWFTFAVQMAILPLTMVIHVALGSTELHDESEENGDIFSPETPEKTIPEGSGEEKATRTFTANN